MIQNLPSDSQVLNASVEIFVMLLWAFALWFVLAWLLKPRESFVVLDSVPLDDFKRSQLYPTVIKKWKPKEMKNVVVEEVTPEIIWKTEELNIDTEDKLSLIHGITPKIEKILKENNIESYRDIIDTDIEGLERICVANRINSKKYNVTTWPDQARLAVDWHWRELEEYQTILQKKK